MHRNRNRNKRRIAAAAIITPSPAALSAAEPPPPPSTWSTRSAAPAPATTSAAAAVMAKQQRRHEEELYLFTGERRSRRGSTSFRSVDAAQVCNHVGFIVVDGPSVVVDGECECSGAKTARQIVSEDGEGGWGGGLKHWLLAATSAFDSTKRRQSSRRPLMAAE